MSRDSPRSERDGARNTRIQIGSGRRSAIPYVLCGGLYSLRCCSMCLVPFEGVPVRPYIIWGNRVTWKVLVEFCQDPSPRSSTGSRVCRLVLLLFRQIQKRQGISMCYSLLQNIPYSWAVPLSRVSQCQLIWSKYYSNKVPHTAREVGSFWWKDILRLNTIYRGIAKCTLENIDLW